MSKKITVAKLIEKIEGEATLKFHFDQDRIEFVDILFGSQRGIEQILEGRPAEDALVINPRVCGICGHAHLIATVKALESCIEGLEISPKASIIRELTLNLELIQNHFKWFYLTLLPQLHLEQKLLLASEVSRLISQAIAHLAGQYPHNSYAIVGGITSEPTSIEILSVRNLLKEVIAFFEKHMVVADTTRLLGCEKTQTLLSHQGDLPQLLNLLLEKGWQSEGRSFDRFIVFGESLYFQRGKSIKTRIQPHISERFVEVSPNSDSLAQNVTYKQKYYEVGPLSRAMLLKTPLIKDAHRRYGDSLFSRILARSCETIQLLHHSLGLLSQIDLSQPSWIEPPQSIKRVSAEGVGAVEAARGSLIHRVKLQEGRIQKWQIITPTQWNLSQGTREMPGVSQQAMIGTDDRALAEFIFKSFDVCSVCTTH